MSDIRVWQGCVKDTRNLVPQGRRFGARYF